MPLRRSIKNRKMAAFDDVHRPRPDDFSDAFADYVLLMRENFHTMLLH